MKLLFDQNLSFRLCRALQDIFPGSSRVEQGGLARSSDAAIWRYAGQQGRTLVSQDADFAEMAALHGPPPKVIWLQVGNRSTAELVALLRRHAELIKAFEQDDTAVCLDLHVR